jgi:hypothetical protein
MLTYRANNTLVNGGSVGLTFSSAKPIADSFLQKLRAVVGPGIWIGHQSAHEFICLASADKIPALVNVANRLHQETIA